MPHRLIAVIGQGTADQHLEQLARQVGRLLAEGGVSLITGGLGGVMAAASEGFHQSSQRTGLVIGILPGFRAEDANPHVDIPIATGMGEARNAIIVSAAEAFVAIGKGYGTLSEIALALKAGKRVISFESWAMDGVLAVPSAEEAVRMILG